MNSTDYQMRGGTLASVAAKASPTSQPDWRAQLRTAIRDPRELARRLALDPALVAPAADRAFACLVPEAFLRRMRVGDAQDPCLRQVLPLAEEMAPQPPGFTADPLEEIDQQVVPGLLHKYHDRALLVCGGACAVHCRYCFRRHFPYQATARPAAWWAPAVAYVAARTALREIIFSGGDPLLLPDQQLAALAQDFAPHVTCLRWHTRLPVVLPDRIDAAFCAWMRAVPGSKVLVLHCNHAQEIDETVRAACARLRECGVHLLNQAVLLRGINDSVSAQAELGAALVAAGVQPYYLHQLDTVAGAAHFAVADAEARVLMRTLHARVSGYLVPRLVREEPHEAGKTPLRW